MKNLGADTVRLQPWATDPTASFRHENFISIVNRNSQKHQGVRQVIPTFKLSVWFDRMMKKDSDEPDPTVRRDLQAFFDSLTKFDKGVVIAWTIDISLSITDIGKISDSGSDLTRQCGTELSLYNNKQHLTRYRKLLEKIREVRSQGGGKGMPFLLPLDIDTAPTDDELQSKIYCMGGKNFWLRQYFDHWLLAVSLPLPADSTNNSVTRVTLNRLKLDQIGKSLAPTNKSAYLMVGAASIKRIKEDAGPGDLLLQEDTPKGTKGTSALHMLKIAWKKINTGSKTSSNTSVKGMILDEWVDDWDRGRHGPFVLADSKEQDRNCGTRYEHDLDAFEGGCLKDIKGSESLDITRPANEYMGLTSQYTMALFHCVTPRFHQNWFDTDNADKAEGECVLLLPNLWWSAAMLVVAGLAFLTSLLLCRDRKFREAFCSFKRDSPLDIRQTGELWSSERVQIISDVIPELRSEKRKLVELKMERGAVQPHLILKAHLKTQCQRLDKQIRIECLAVEARRKAGAVSEQQETVHQEAMQNIHARVLEGVASWAELRKEDLHEKVVKNYGRPRSDLFTEALLVRLIESLAEQLISCPERLCDIYASILSQTGQEGGAAVYIIDLVRLHKGIESMKVNSNPYRGGLNFDDINDCGLRCEEDIQKTFQEPATFMVLLEMALNYRAPIAIKLYSFMLAMYLYIGSGRGTYATSHNGSLWWPKWERTNMLVEAALLDSFVWSVVQLLLFVHRGQQRGFKTGKIYMHLVSMAISVAGGAVVGSLSPNLERRVHPSDDDTRGKPWVAVAYFVVRWIIFAITHHGRNPMLISGSPGRVHERSHKLRKKCTVVLAWLVILGCCVLWTAHSMLPLTLHLTWAERCGFSLTGGLLPVSKGGDIESMIGPCQDRLLRSDCVACIGSISAVWCLVLTFSLFLDVYFAFYLFSAIGGFAMGHQRGLNNLKNPLRTVDLRVPTGPNGEAGFEAHMMLTIFGNRWQDVWMKIVESLYDDDLVSDGHANQLAAAAGQDRIRQRTDSDEEEQLHLEHKPFDLSKLDNEARERLATFFGSLPGIFGRQSKQRNNFNHERDALTTCHVGTVPSLSQVIPVFNEGVIPTHKFLTQGEKLLDACNQEHSTTAVKTLPPKGDGQNTNLGFIISQHFEEWVYLAKRLNAGSPMALYNKFVKLTPLDDAEVMAIRLWAAMRSQTVARTVIGAMQYQLFLRDLPNFKAQYELQEQEHAEVVLSHQTFGFKSPKGDRENDRSVQYLMQKYSGLAFYLVFDYDSAASLERVAKMVEDFLLDNFDSYQARSVQYASCKAEWSEREGQIQLTEVLPRQHELRIGSKDYLTQGKACNQINALHFTSGHLVQAMDANMGVFFGEACKIPFALNYVMPFECPNRRQADCRYLGFRERIYTMGDGVVGECLASAEWTFGTIFQRFLSGMGARMHYGHPDFCDGFWVLNRGGMSKSSASINLSEDIFAGYNCKMRDEECPHIDFLEFLKGREATLLASSGFFAKVSGGSVSMMRSRDLQLLCDNIGLVNCFSFYFASIGFYISNLLVDFTIYVYVTLFVLFVFASESVAKLDNLGTQLSTEWLLSAGLLSGVPQLMELILEYGAGTAFLKFIPQFFSNVVFFMFQNKTIASAMEQGIATGEASYIATGRPLANLHHTWRDNYIAYCYSHYFPALQLLSLLIIYRLLTNMDRDGGAMPMIFSFASVFVWLCAPVIFTPLPGVNLLKQDIQGLMEFIIAPLPQDTGVGKQAIAQKDKRMAGLQMAGLAVAESLLDVDEDSKESKHGSDEELTQQQIIQEEKATLRKPEEMRSLLEWGFSQELHEHRSRTVRMKFLLCILSTFQTILLLVLVNGNILDHLYPFIFVFFLRWIIIVISFMRDSNNFLSFFAVLVWLLVPLINSPMVGYRGYSGYTELIITLFVFMWILRTIRHWFLLITSGASGQRQDQVVRYAHYFFCSSDIETVAAVIVLCIHILVALMMISVESFCCCCFKRGAHTWWLLNKNVAEPTYEKRKLPYQPKLHSRFRDDSEIGVKRDADPENQENFLIHRAPQRPRDGARGAA